MSDAIVKGDINTATQEKYILEEKQRQNAKERKVMMEEWVPNLFERDPLTSDWIYKHAEYVFKYL